jgi:hypothetical protein
MKYLVFITLSLIAAGVSLAEITIPANTIIPVRATKPVDADYVQAGQEVILVVAANISINKTTVIKAGAPVIAFVSDSSDSQMAGISGNLSLAIRSTVAIDGATVPLSGMMMNSGDSEVGSTVAVSVILCPLALLNKGKPGRIIPGMEVRAMTVGEVTVDPDNPIEIEYRSTEIVPKRPVVHEEPGALE